jgi:hypothetical protein
VLRFLNWIETLDALTQLDVPVREEVMAYIQDLVLPAKAEGDVDPVFGRSVQFEVRSGLLLFCDVDSATNTVEVLSLELLVSKSSLA